MALGVLALSLTLSLMLIAGYLWWETQALTEETGIPDGDVIYDDTGVWRAQSESLTAPAIGLSGKPDYLIQQRDGTIIPVEVKSGVAPRKPYDAHMMQLAAYCLLVEENYGIRPPYGVIKYANQSYEVDFTDELEEDLLDTLTLMREDLYAEDVNRSHENISKCNACGVRAYCDQRLR